MDDETPHDVFISHSHKDKTTADAICALLERDGVRCWMAPRDVLPGDEWAQTIVRGINGARVFVLVFSSASNASAQVRREVERAANRELPIIPFRIEDQTPNEALEFFISSPHWMDAFTPPLALHIQELASAVHRLLARSAAPRTVPPRAAAPPADPPAASPPPQATAAATTEHVPAKNAPAAPEPPRANPPAQLDQTAQARGRSRLQLASAGISLLLMVLFFIAAANAAASQQLQLCGVAFLFGGIGTWLGLSSAIRKVNVVTVILYCALVGPWVLAALVCFLAASSP